MWPVVASKLVLPKASLSVGSNKEGFELSFSPAVLPDCPKLEQKKGNLNLEVAQAGALDMLHSHR